MFQSLLASQFWGDDPISQFFRYYWLPIFAVLIVLIVLSRRRKR